MLDWSQCPAEPRGRVKFHVTEVVAAVKLYAPATSWS